MVHNRKFNSSRPYFKNRKRQSFKGRKRVGHSTQIQSEPSQEEDDLENVFIDHTDGRKQKDKLFIEPKDRMTLPSHNVRPNHETLKRLNGAYEALRQTTKYVKRNKRIFPSSRSSISHLSQESPSLESKASTSIIPLASNQEYGRFNKNSRCGYTEIESENLRYDYSNDRDTLSPSQQTTVLSELNRSMPVNWYNSQFPEHMTIPDHTSAIPWHSSSTVDGFFEWHNQPVISNQTSPLARARSIEASEPSSSTAVQTSYPYMSTRSSPTRSNIWLSQANSNASVPTPFRKQSNIFMDQMTEQDSGNFIPVEDEMHSFASSGALNQDNVYHEAATRSLLPPSSIQGFTVSGNRSSEMEREGYHSFDEESNQAASMPLSQNTLVSFLESSKKDNQLPSNGLRYFHVKSEPLE